jgi:hypothetical protein
MVNLCSYLTISYLIIVTIVSPILILLTFIHPLTVILISIKLFVNFIS